MFRAICFLLVSGSLIASLQAPRALGQADAFVELYGEGVHRFFAGDLPATQELMTRVIDSGSDDPRAYYYRGLVQEYQGGDGTADFEQGARLEAEGRRAYPVGLALSRVQGSVRGKIEKARRDARVVYRQQQLAMEQARLEEMRNTPGVAESEFSPPAPADTGDAPFAEEGMRSAETTEDPEQPNAAEVDASSDPFTDDPGAPAEVAEPAPAENPFGEGSGDAANPFGEDTGAGEAANPFGNSGADAGNPFGEAPAEGADSGSNPFDGGNPFGN